MSPGWLALLGVGVAVAAALYDFSIARWAVAMQGVADPDDAIARASAARAARWSVMIYAVGLVGVLGVLKISLWLIAPEAVGLYTGTYLGARWTRKREATGDDGG